MSTPKTQAKTVAVAAAQAITGQASGDENKAAAEDSKPTIVKIERDGLKTLTHWSEGEPTPITHTSEEAAKDYAGE